MTKENYDKAVDIIHKLYIIDCIITSDFKLKVTYNNFLKELSELFKDDFITFLKNKRKELEKQFEEL